MSTPLFAFAGGGGGGGGTGGSGSSVPVMNSLFHLLFVVIALTIYRKKK